jgi:hypothetical protein
MPWPGVGASILGLPCHPIRDPSRSAPLRTKCFSHVAFETGAISEKRVEEIMEDIAAHIRARTNATVEVVPL